MPFLQVLLINKFIHVTTTEILTLTQVVMKYVKKKNRLKKNIIILWY